ncbi:glycosyltransferase [Anaeromusa sp.]|uniref:glycosyltransferase family 2 protein n=1 Tax=Anaeromusa sp. TaxID=1872520 RepID=UPI00261D719A|nr:glycosyltransferase [Anaeromusa sp.]MDD3157095.1 glycosyltransferase [Anaeromusa sp.]
MPAVSVLMCAYNHQAYVKEAVASVVAQSFSDWEMIIVDDGSTDGTAEEILKIKDPRIRLLRFAHNRGVGEAAKVCLQEARGQYIASLNSDDAFEPDKLERQVAFLQKNKQYVAVLSQVRLVDEAGQSFVDARHPYMRLFRQPNRSRQEWLNRFFYGGNCLCQSSMLIRRECYQELGGYDSRLAQVMDLDFWIRFCKQYELYVLPAELTVFRLHTENSSQRKAENEFRLSMELMLLLEHYANLDSCEEFRRIFPDCPEEILPTMGELIPVALGRMILETQRPNRPHYRCFAQQILQKAFGNVRVAQLLRQEYGWTVKDLWRWTGEYDVFGQVPDVVSRFYLIRQGVQEPELLQALALPWQENFSVEVDLQGFTDGKTLSWQPIQGRICALKMDDMEYRTHQGVWQPVGKEQVKINGTGNREGIWLFETLQPLVSFTAIEGWRGLRLRGKWRFWNDAEMEQEYQQLRQGILGLQRQVEHLSAQLKSLSATETGVR